MIEYEDFTKLDLRIGTIEQVEEIPKADKLYKISVNLGSETRTLVAGIKQSYEKDYLIGKQITVITNLKPRKLRGVESQGMLLAASIDGKAVILTPDSKVSNGSLVK